VRGKKRHLKVEEEEEFIKENEDGVSIYQTPSLVIAFGKETNNKKDLYSISIVRKKQGQ